VNIERDYASALERDLAQVLRDLMSNVCWLQRWNVEPAAVNGGWDLKGSGPIPGGGKAVVCVECKGPNFQPSQFTSLVGRVCSAGRKAASSKVLAMPRVTPRMAALCQAHGWSWYDLAGNCRLEIPGVFLIERSGNEPVKAQPRSGANLSTPEAARVVRALLAPENAGRRWTQREIVAHFADLTPRVPSPSLALVNKVVQHLRDQAFLEQLPNRGFRVRDWEGLLQAWRAAYRFVRHSRRPYFTLLQGRALQDRLQALDPEGRGRLAYAVFSAADLQAPAVRQPRTWLYLDPNVEQEFRSAVEAKPVDSGENLIVLIPNDAGVFYRVESGSNRLACTNAVQTYVDLAHAGGRGEEAAEAILQQRLKPAWSTVTR
jgi:transcriptional regulator with AbiEi antitoxin domain of type IV toxin-antitoxin system